MKSSFPTTWRDLVTVQGRYRRSIHIERDAAEDGWADGYVVTPLGRSLIKRVVDGLAHDQGQKAWSITGPYGSGKSAFVLFLSRLLGIGNSPETRATRAILEGEDRFLAGQLFGRAGAIKSRDGLIPVLITGERQPLELLLVAALRKAAQRFWSGRGVRPDVLSRLDDLHQRALSGKLPSTRDVVQSFEDVARKVAQSAQDGDGLLVVLDEAGKTLELAAQGRDKGDIHLLQELAEAASRSAKVPIVFVVVLHQAFEQYAGRLNLAQRNEWAKVQGRFEDLPFQEATDQLLRLIGTAIQKNSLPTDLSKKVNSIARDLVEVSARREGERGPQIASLLAGAAPLHPVTALAIGPLFRSRLAQNERSIFSFLSSAEPNGFQEFLDRRLDRSYPLYTLDRLYDYISSNLGGRLFGQQGQYWAQVETSLRRLGPDAQELEVRLLKGIGILSMTADQTGIGASEDVLALAFGESGSPQAVRQSLERLKAASLVVYRKFKGAYQLWEGSDLDIDKLTARVTAQIDERQSLVAYLERVAPPRPLVALRHYFETGTLRYFDVRYLDDLNDAQGIVAASQADGAVLVLVPGVKVLSEDEAREAVKGIRSSGGRPVLVAVVGPGFRIRELAFDLAALEKVQTNTPQLHDDPAARRELAGRMAEAERQLTAELQLILAGGGDSRWFANGRALPVDSPKALASALSDVCDRAYASAPVVQSELINRKTLSGSAAAARRLLLEAMIEHPSEEQLGMTGAPPELAIYRSVLGVHGIHGCQGTRWGFSPPAEKSGAFRIWEEIGQTIERSGERRVPLPELHAVLAKPPFGLRAGLIPLFVVAYMIVEGDELAFYEDETFVPALSTPALERMLRTPERFQVQRFRIAGERTPLFQRLLVSLMGGKADPRFSVVPLIKYLVRFMRELPDYSRNTKSVSQNAQGVREAILRAQEPGPLVFDTLPKACGLASFSAEEAADEVKADKFVATLRVALRELQVAYPSLLNMIEQLLGTSFNLSAATLRKELSGRSKHVSLLAVDAQLRGFLIRAGDDALDRESWLVSIGTLLVGKPPDGWHDRDVDQLRVALGFMSRKFRALESLMLAGLTPTSLAGPQLVRIAIARSGETEQERVVAIRDEDQVQVADLCVGFKDLLRTRAATLPADSVLGALALIAGTFLSQEHAAPGQQKVSNE